jgi:hypothetical protein
MGKCGTHIKPNMKAMAETAMAFSVEPAARKLVVRICRMIDPIDKYF